jgi:hypothetical protein
MRFLNRNIFDPILNSEKASIKLKIGVRQTKSKLRRQDALGMMKFYWSSIAGTARSTSFSAQMKKEGFTRFEEMMPEFREKFNEEWLRKKM